MKSFKTYINEVESLSLADTDQQFLRNSITAEQDAIVLYERFANKTKNPEVKKLLLDVAKEEKVHVHEFQTLLFKIDPEENSTQKDAKKEVDNLLKEN